MLNILDIGASGLMAQRTRLNTLALNIANVDTVADENGKNNPYKRRFVVLEPGQANDPKKPGVHVAKVDQDTVSPLRIVKDPFNPLADKNGNVLHPNVDLTSEFVNALEASRAYDANITMMETTKSMFNASLRLLG